MTREEAIRLLQATRMMLLGEDNQPVSDLYEALDMAIQALSQEPCELLIIKSDILLHQDDRKKWMDSIKREKENGVIILPPYFTPLLVPNDVEVKIEQEPCLNSDEKGEVKQEVKQEPCEKCEVGNPCLYCKHEFEPQESEDKE